MMFFNIELSYSKYFTTLNDIYKYYYDCDNKQYVNKRSNSIAAHNPE